MITEFGHLALILAFCVALVQATVPMLGAARVHRSIWNLGGPAGRAQAQRTAGRHNCRRGPGRESARLIVASKRGNARGAKGPQFKVDVRRNESREIGDEPNTSRKG